MSLRDFCEPGDTYVDLVNGTRELITEEDEMSWSEMVTTLPSGQEITVGVGTSDADGSALVIVDTGGVQGNVRIIVNDGDPVFDENPETGEYQDMSPEGDDDGSA